VQIGQNGRREHINAPQQVVAWDDLIEAKPACKRAAADPDPAIIVDSPAAA
jgi:hypothetical protein